MRPARRVTTRTDLVNAKGLGTMTLEQFSDKPWPAEGRTLGEIIEWLVGPELWVYLLDWTGDRLLPSTTNSNHKQKLKPPATSGLHVRLYSPPVQRQSYQLCTGPAWHSARFMLGTAVFRIAHDLRFPSSTDHRCRQAVDACLPFLDAWNSGTIIAKARAGGPLEPLTDIPPPRAGYTLTVRSLLRSVIIDPTDPPNPKRYFDVRFFPPEQAAEQMTRPLSSAETENTGPDPFKTGTAGRPTAKNIVLAEAERRIRDREVVPKQGGLAEFSRSLESWWQNKRGTYEPPGPAMTASAIRNAGVRDLWNVALRGI